LAVVLLLSVVSISIPVTRGDDFSEAALDYVSRTEGISRSRLKVGYVGPLVLKTINEQFWDGKVVDTSTGRTYGVTLDMNKKPVVRDSLLEREFAARTAKYGKMTEELHKHLETGGTVSIGIWLDLKAAGPSGRETSLDEVAGWTTSAMAGFKSFLESRGAKIKYVCKLAPLVYAEVSTTLLKAIEAHESVELMDIEGVGGPEMNISVPTIGAPTVWARGFTGAGCKVAVVEGDAIWFGHAAIPDGAFYQTPTGAAGYDDHATTCGGIIASTDPTYKGVAYGIDGSTASPRLLSANSGSYTDSAMIAATEWALMQGAHITTHSYYLYIDGVPHTIDYYFDHVIYHHGRVMIKSAGNRGTGDGYVTSPGCGYNTITVGSFNDMNTVAWSGDAMSDFSSYVNPVHPNGDQPEKPEIVAPGHNIYAPLYYSPYWGSWSGTSFSAPHVAGAAALLIHRHPRLKAWPEAIKALLMTTAIHNIEGSTRLSEYDGAGGIYLPYADAAAKGAGSGGGWAAGWYSHDSFDASWQFYAANGQRVRVAIVWDAQPAHAHPPTSSPRLADIDLDIYNPAGTWIQGSWSVSNCFEIVDFTATSTGYYTATATIYSHLAEFGGDVLAFAYWAGPAGAPLGLSSTPESSPELLVQASDMWALPEMVSALTYLANKLD